MTVDLQEIKRAIAFIEKTGKIAEVEVEIDPMQRLILKYVEPMGGDSTSITFFAAETQKMAEITITTRLP